MQALVEVVVEGRLPDFSVQEIAERAGVSHRTIYRHFPSRDDLLAGLMEWVEESMVELGAPFSADDTGELIAASAANFRLFDALSEKIEAMTRFSLGTGIEPVRRRGRTDMFTSLVDEELADLEPEQRQMVAGLIRLLTGTRAWLVLRQDGVTPPDQVGETLQWATATLLEAARSGNTPFPGSTGA